MDIHETQQTEVNVRTFRGDLQKIRIVSNNLSYGLPPEPETEVEQHLTLNRDGRVWFSAYNFGHGEKYEKARSRNFKIGMADTDRLFHAISAYFSNDYMGIYVTDIGDWSLELTNTDGIIYKFHSSLCSNLIYKGIDLSDLVRDTVGMDDLYVFDGNRKSEAINKISLDYHRVTKMKPGQMPEGVDWKYITWDYTERLIIDRKTETLEHIQNIGSGCKVSRKYEVEGGIESLLDSFDEEELFANIEGNPEDAIGNPLEAKDYKLTIEYRKQPSRVITGSFDKKGLPDDFSDFVEAIWDFIRFYGLGEILDPAVYGRAKRRKSEYIFCSVTFDEGYRNYYYLTDDDFIEIGDYVLVPAGKDNHEAVVKVMKIEYFDEVHAPFLIEKTKWVIRKCTDKDLESYAENDKAMVAGKNPVNICCDEIEYPYKKKDEICGLFSGYKIIEHTNAEPDYTYLEDDDVILEIVNPYRDENLFIELAAEFTLFFGDWHCHYFADEEDYCEMKKDALALVNGEYGVLGLYAEGKWLGNTLLKEKVSDSTEPWTLIDKMNFPEEFLQKIRTKGASIPVDYWRTKGRYKFDVSSCNTMTEKK